jgi:outer membrane protein assembly factor BamB
VRWKRQAGAGVFGHRASRSRLYAVSLDDELLCLDSRPGGRSGRIVERDPGGEDGMVRHDSALDSNTVFFGSQDGTVFALDAGSRNVQWRREVGSPVTTPITIRGTTSISPPGPIVCCGWTVVTAGSWPRSRWSQRVWSGPCGW